MNDLISRQAAINAADRADYRGLTVEDVKKVTDEVVKELKQIPAADVEEVIRCEKCMHAKKRNYAPAKCQWYCSLSTNYHMSRYIDADRLEECMRIVQMANKDSVEFNKRYRATDVFLNIRDMIKEQPTADVVEVVRCKDCSNWDRHWISSLFSENVHYCVFIDGPCNDDFYCGAAIKRPVIGGDKH